MRKAFMAMDTNHSGAIGHDEFKFYLSHWGVSAS